MTQVANTVKSVKNIRLKIGATDTYELHANNVAWSKNTTSVEWVGGTPEAQYSDSVVTTHVCAITLAKDYQNEDSLFNWMIDHEGETGTRDPGPGTSGPGTGTSAGKRAPTESACHRGHL